MSERFKVSPCDVADGLAFLLIAKHGTPIAQIAALAGLSEEDVKQRMNAAQPHAALNTASIAPVGAGTTRMTRR